MVGHPGLSSELAPASHLDRARQADLCGEARVFANLAVVANMHVVVELCAAPDQGRAHLGTVDSGQRADSTSSSIATEPICGILTSDPACSTKPKPSAPMTA